MTGKTLRGRPSSFYLHVALINGAALQGLPEVLAHMLMESAEACKSCISDIPAHDHRCWWMLLMVAIHRKEKSRLIYSIMALALHGTSWQRYVAMQVHEMRLLPAAAECGSMQRCHDGRAHGCIGFNV